MVYRVLRNQKRMNGCIDKINEYMIISEDVKTITSEYSFYDKEIDSLSIR